MSVENCLEWEHDQSTSKWKAKSVAAFRRTPLFPVWWTIHVTNRGNFVVGGSSPLWAGLSDVREKQVSFAQFSSARQFCEDADLELDSALSRAAEFYMRMPSAGPAS